MLSTKFGIEIEFTGITREKAAKVWQQNFCRELIQKVAHITTPRR